MHGLESDSTRVRMAAGEIAGQPDPSPIERRKSMLGRLARDLERQGIPALALKWLDRADQQGTSDTPNDLQLLVPRSRAAAARRILDDAGWRFELGNQGLWRYVRRATYVWDDGFQLHLHWGVPAAPLPSRALSGLERLLWARASRSPSGFLEPDSESMLVYRALQAARSGFRHDARFRDFAACANATLDWGRVASIARQARVDQVVHRALEQLRSPSPPGPSFPLLDGLWGRAEWSLARALSRSVPRRLRGLIGGTRWPGETPWVGEAITRCRFAGVDLLAGRGTWVPQAAGEPLAWLASERVGQEERPIVVDVGTGCGGVALALAARHKGVEVHATDISRRSLRWAKRNSRRLGIRTVLWHRGSLLEPLPRRLEGQVTAVVSNIPFVPGEQWEPAWGSVEAVVGPGPDGLGLVRELARQAVRYLRPGGWLVLQLGPEQWELLSVELSSLGYRPGGAWRQETEGVDGRADVVVWAEITRAPTQ